MAGWMKQMSGFTCFCGHRQNLFMSDNKQEIRLEVIKTCVNEIFFSLKTSDTKEFWCLFCLDDECWHGWQIFFYMRRNTKKVVIRSYLEILSLFFIYLIIFFGNNFWPETIYGYLVPFKHKVMRFWYIPCYYCFKADLKKKKQLKHEISSCHLQENVNIDSKN